MKKITLSADEDLIEQARLIARKKHTTLNQAFRDWLAEYTRRSSVEASIEAVYKRLSHIDSGGKYSRESMNER